MRHFRFLQDVSARRWGSGLRHFRSKERQSDTAQPAVVRFRPLQPRYGRVLGSAQPPSIHPPRSTPAPRRAQPCSPAHPSSSERRAQNSWGPRFSVLPAQKHAKETCWGTRAAFPAAQVAPLFQRACPGSSPRDGGEGAAGRACVITGGGWANVGANARATLSRSLPTAASWPVRVGIFIVDEAG